ncbi:hypothetical protein FA13DRAFT_158051 [Coprinellus micaceus]|uniref:Uncharacterized protein n=1 Tax=Coprinellus micaceus TaxID=71717 RepID=A0A4Y7TH69_COPMI|nr:hypothetical protein FA13DRAFT_158051 [Coprinellus micaceus]
MFERYLVVLPLPLIHLFPNGPLMPLIKRAFRVGILYRSFPVFPQHPINGRPALLVLLVLLIHILPLPIISFCCRHRGSIFGCAGWRCVALNGVQESHSGQVNVMLIVLVPPQH